MNEPLKRVLTEALEVKRAALDLLSEEIRSIIDELTHLEDEVRRGEYQVTHCLSWHPEHGRCVLPRHGQRTAHESLSHTAWWGEPGHEVVESTPHGPGGQPFYEAVKPTKGG